MAFEGFFYIESENFNQEEISAQYQDTAFSDGGYIGIKDKHRLRNEVYSVAGFIKTHLGETKVVSNMTHDFVSPFFLSYQPDNALNIGARAEFDERAMRLVLTRELFGQCPLYYVIIPNKLIAFSTDLRSLVTNSLVRRHVSIDYQRLISYATFARDAGAVYSDHTFYDQVKCVLPGHSLELNFSGAQTSTPAFQFTPSRWSHLKTIGEFGEEFRHRFAKSVDRCISDPSLKVASHLSGGLDSSSVSSVVRYLYPQRTVHTLYNNSHTTDTDEYLFVRGVAQKLNTTHHEILQSEEDFKIHQWQVRLGGQPSSTFVSPSFTSSLLEYAKNLGCDIVLNGTDGDSIAGSGLELINNSFLKRDWALVQDLLHKRIRYYTYAYKYPNWNSFSEKKKYNIVLQNFLYTRISAKLLSSPFQDFREFYRDVSDNLAVSYPYFLSRGIGSVLNKFRKKQLRPSSHILRQDFIREFTAPTQPESSPMDALLEPGATEEQKRALRDVYNGQTIFSNEQSFLLSQHYGIANGSPFYDKDLFEVCLAVPEIMKFGDGIGRSHFREAMKGILPEEVRCRSTKTHVGRQGQEMVARMYREATSLLAESSEIWHYVDAASFAHQVSLLQNDKVPYTHKMYTMFHIARTISMATWLEWLNENRAL